MLGLALAVHILKDCAPCNLPAVDDQSVDRNTGMLPGLFQCVFIRLRQLLAIIRRRHLAPDTDFAHDMKCRLIIGIIIEGSNVSQSREE